MSYRFWNKNIFYSLLVILILIYPFLVGKSPYYMSLFVTVSVFAIASMALNLLVGYGGQVSVGNAGFLTVGAYTVAILANKFGLPIWILIPASGIMIGLIGLLIGLPAVRLKGHFLAVATLGFGLSIPPIVLNWDSLTKGVTGMAVLRPASISGDLPFFYVIAGVTVLITWIITNIVNSRMGRAFMAIRESEITAEATGINTAFYKTIMFVISAFFTGIAGALNAYWIGFVSPEDYSVMTSLHLLAMIVVGGLASIPGSIIGALLFTVLPHFTESFVGITNMVIGAILILIIVFRPSGLISLADSVMRRRNRKESDHYAQV